MSEEKKGFFDGLVGRFGHPIIGAFTFYWLIINWDVVFILVRGGADYKDTIGLLWRDYFIPANHSRLLTYPVVFTVVYVVAGPFFGDMVDLIPKWSKLWWDGLSPVPKKEMISLKAQLEASEKDKNLNIQAYNLVRNTADPQQLIVNLQRQVNQCSERENAYQTEIATLKADKVVAALGHDVDLIKAENIAITKAKYGLVELANAYLEFKSKHLALIRGTIAQRKGKELSAQEADEVLMEINKLSELIRKADIPGVKLELEKLAPTPRLKPPARDEKSISEIGEELANAYERRGEELEY